MKYYVQPMCHISEIEGPIFGPFEGNGVHLVYTGLSVCGVYVANTTPDGRWKIHKSEVCDKVIAFPVHHEVVQTEIEWDRWWGDIKIWGEA